MSVTAPLLHAVVWEEGCPPTACVHVCVCHTLLHPPTLHLVRVGAHICVLIFLEAHGCPLPLSSSSSSSSSFTTTSCGGEGEQPCTAAMHSSHAQQSRSGSEMIITNLAVCWHAMCCWMLMQSTRSTTLVRHLTHLYSSTAFPFPLSLTMRHTATPQRRR